MATRSKIKIIDDIGLRNDIEQCTELLDHVALAKWAMAVANHVHDCLESEFPNNAELEAAIEVNALWQKGESTVHQVRAAGFAVHAVARACKSETARAAARAMGQAIAVGHMRRHAMVASDYAIKAIGLDAQGDLKRITEERLWQLNEIKKFIKVI